jgi:uncharacterized membrane protein YeaQ/YmgE (transglycosylase-associated protein family)
VDVHKYYIINLNKNFMEILLWIVFGALVGWIASIIMRTNAEQGAILNIVVGVVGAVLGGWIMNALGYTGVNGFNLYSFVVALLGAIVLIGIVRAIRGATTREHRTI